MILQSWQKPDENSVKMQYVLFFSLFFISQSDRRVAYQLISWYMHWKPSTIYWWLDIGTVFCGSFKPSFPSGDLS